MNELENLMLINVILGFMLIFALVFFLRSIKILNKKAELMDNVIERTEEFLIVKELGL